MPQRIITVLIMAFQLALAAVATSDAGALGLPKEALGWMVILNVALVAIVNKLDWILTGEDG